MRSPKWQLYKWINQKENITTFTFTEQQLRKQIDDIQIELRSCVNKIHGEMKKQVRVSYTGESVDGIDFGLEGGNV